MKCNRTAMWLVVLAALAMQAGAQVLTIEQAKKLAPSTYYFAGQSAAVQARNTAGFKSSGGKIVLAGFVDTSGYSTAIKEKYQGFLITETKLSFDGGTLRAGGVRIWFQRWQVHRYECGVHRSVFDRKSE